jgi:hypothetical protein
MSELLIGSCQLYYCHEREGSVAYKRAFSDWTLAAYTAYDYNSSLWRYRQITQLQFVV